MDSYTILLLDQLCEPNLINQLFQYQSQQNWSEMKQLIQNKLSLVEKQSSSQFQSRIIATRDIQYTLIQRINGSIRHTLAQLEKLEESIMLVINKLPSNDSMRGKLRLFATFLSQVKENLKQIALLEMKQIITSLISQISTEIIDIQLNDLLQRIKINYRFFLGYEVLEGEELDTFSQISYKRNRTPVVSRETRVESIIYHRRTNADKKCNVIIEDKINKTIFKILTERFDKWKKEFIENPMENESLETICILWYKTMEEVKQILLEKPYKDSQVEGQLDLWNYQKKKSLL